MRTWIAFLLAAALALLVPVAAQTTRNTLSVYLIDVEGGNATLFVGPTGQSLLMDAGNVNGAERDASRILAAAKDAGLTQIDHLMITHWHGDHFGGVPEIVKQIPVKDFMDHGPNAKWPGIGADLNGVKFAQEQWPGFYAKGTHTVVKVGDKINLGPGVDVRAIASNGEFLKTPLPGGGQANPSCDPNYKPVEDANMEDGWSLALYVGYGKFRSVQPGDLLINQEVQLMCPKNPIGTIDALLGLHHGQAVSNSPMLIHALHPRVAIMNNGTRKGGEPPTMTSVYTSPGLQDLWQLHESQLSGQQYTTPGLFVANYADDQKEIAVDPIPNPGRGGPPPPAHNGPASWIKLTAHADGSFTVTNTRDNFTKSYPPR